MISVPSGVADFWHHTLMKLNRPGVHGAAPGRCGLLG